MIPEIVFTQLDAAADAEALVTFLARNAFPFHRSPTATPEQARKTVYDGRFWSDETVGFWINADEQRIGLAVVDGLTDIASGGNPVFDLRWDDL
jgi:hypothetical protein